jgi:acetyl esterase/lipase
MDRPVSLTLGTEVARLVGVYQPPFRILTVCTVVLGGCGPDVAIESDVSYDDRFDVAKLDVYSPSRSDTPRPAVIVIHGGGWKDSFSRSGMADHSYRLAAAGYVAFNIDYRGTPTGGEFPHAVQDCICALAFVRTHADEFGIDPARIATFGYSAGGHLASMLGVAAADPVVTPDCEAGATTPVAAVVSGAGPQLLELLPEVETVTSFVGGRYDEVPERYAQASPLTYVAPGAPPFLLINGEADWFVDIEHAHRMQSALDAVGTENRLLAIPGGGHLLNRSPGGASWDVQLSIDTPEAWAATIDFLDRKIGPVQ